MFMGEYQHSLDSKGRLTIPVKLRDELGGERFIVTRGGLDRCLFVYPPLSEWSNLEQKLKELPPLSKGEARAFVRFSLLEPQNVS